MGSHLSPLYALSSRSSYSIFKSLSAACNYKPNQRYSRLSSSESVGKGEHTHAHTQVVVDIEERAPSTAEEFKRVAEEKMKEAEEKLKEAEQGVASQTVDKTYDGTEEATLGNSTLDSVKNRYKQREPGADCRRRPRDDP